MTRAPGFGGWSPIQAFLVDAIKRRAIARLHRTASGEALLLRIYLWAEEGVEVEGLVDLRRLSPPPWLAEQLRGHLADESRHAALLRRRLRALGADTGAPGRVDPLSRFKLAWLRRIGGRAAPSFRAGACVSLLAVAYRMEAMGVRVLRRHVGVLEAAAGAQKPALALLRAILADEECHVTACRAALDRLVDDAERPALEALVARIDGVDRAFGVTGALALLALSLLPRRPLRAGARAFAEGLSARLPR
jgi:hypothetical protein